MGTGRWDKKSADSYVEAKYSTYTVPKAVVSPTGSISYVESKITSVDDLFDLDVKQVYEAHTLDPVLNPYMVKRECRDSEEHPNTIPVILALDVTGSMGKAAKACAAKLNDIMENLYGKVKDVEFMMMGIGDLSYDTSPIQATQFESDVRILDQTTKIYFEAGGGGNEFESYTAAWLFGLNNTDLDCWKRGRKGIIITLGDEPLNPYLPGAKLKKHLGSGGQDIDTDVLYKAASEKFDIYHIAITDRECSFGYYKTKIENSWGKLLGDKCFYANTNELPKVISDIVEKSNGVAITNNEGYISW